MSTEALEIRRQQAEDYYAYHPDSVTISVVGTDSTFPGLFDHYAEDGDKDGGNVSQMRRIPRILAYSGYSTLIIAGTSSVIVEGVTYRVVSMEADPDKYEVVLWLA
jgi:hypothetical protein